MRGLRIGKGIGLGLGSKRWVEEQLTDMATGDFSASVTLERKEAGIAGTLKRTIRSLQSLLRVVERTGKQLYADMGTVEGKAADIAGQVEGVTATVREIAVGMQDASGNVQRMADDMIQVDQLLRSVQESNGELVRSSGQFAAEVEAGKRELAQAGGQMQRISEESERLRQGMYELDSTLDQIAGILKLIEDISGQTQLLALNANIEAARAGEHGRGFAIVASEISKLAVQTKQATEDIEGKIETLSGNGRELHATVGRMEAAVLDGAAAMGSAVAKYGEMQSYLGSVLERMDDVSRQFASAAGHVDAAVDAVTLTSAMVEQTAAGCEEVLASSEMQLQSVLDVKTAIERTTRGALTLRSVISQFKLPPREHSNPLKLAIEGWIEGALTVRAIMVSMIESRDSGRIQYWSIQKEKAEKELAERFTQLEQACSLTEDRRYALELYAAWERFGQAKEQNARWMLEGEFEKARDGLMRHGRERFKRTLDIASEWLEAR
jgi:methyl-accepting chemotaxis protein